ncbi:MAG: oxidoreductase [Rhodococcus sp. (in: high G+C Gram-positive bacteria)]
MGLFDRFKRRGGSAKRGPEGSVAQYLADWTAERIGVEAYVEPKTTVTPLTVVLVANDGEWTRRPLGEKYVRKIGSDLKIPVYDVRKTGYPQRMRDHDARQKIVRKREQQQRDL